MNTAHVVEQLHFEVGFASEEEAFDLQSRIGRFVGERAPRIVDQVFSEACEGTEVLQFERLEIDLGLLPRHESDQEWEQRLAEALRRGLASDPGPADASPAAQERRRLARAQADLELLWHWLHHGTLPWHATQGDTGAVDALVARVLAAQGVAFAAALRRNRQRERLLRRAVHQWSDQRLLALGRLLSGDAHMALPAALERPRSAGERLQGWERWLAACAQGESQVAGRPLAEVVAVPVADGALVQALVHGVDGPRAARELARRLIEALDADAPALVRLLRRHPPAAATWTALLPWCAPGERRALVIALAPPGDGEFMCDLADSVMLRSLSPLPDAADRALRVQGAVLGLLLGAPAQAIDRSRVLQAVAADLMARPRSGAVEAGAEVLRAQLQPLLQSATLCNLTPPALLAAMRRWAGRPEGRSGRVAGEGAGSTPATAAAAVSRAAAAAAATETAPAADAASTVPVETVPSWLAAAQAALADARLPADELAWQRLVNGHAPWLASQLAMHGRDAAWRQGFAAALPAPAWRQTLQLFLSPRDAEELLAFCDRLCAALAAAAPSPSDTSTEQLMRAAVVGWLARQADAGPDAEVDPAAADAAPAAASVDRGPAALRPLPRFDAPRCTAWLLHHLADEHDVDPVQWPPGASDASGEAFRMRPVAPPAPPMTAPPPSLDMLIEAVLGDRRRPEASLRRRLVQGLAAVPTGAAAWRSLAAPRRSALLSQLRPEEGASAVAVLELLQQAARASALPMPTAEQELLGWERLRHELFVEARPFEPAGFARRWLRAVWSRVAERSGRPAALAWAGRLTLAAEAPTQKDLRGTATATVRAFDPAAPATPLPAEPSGPTTTAAPPRAAAQPAAVKRADWAVAVLAAVKGAADALARRAGRADPPWTFPAEAPPDPVTSGETVYLHNAGLVLAGPYLPRLLARLDLVQDQRFRDDEAAERAVHLLQWLVTGRRAAAEHELVLNKLLCGLPAAHPVPSHVELTDEETAAADGLLRALIEHWKVLGRTSVAGLRETFLMRDGALSHADEGWRLVVAPRAFDMLLDQLPWGYRTLRFPWMPEVLRVEWR